MPKKLIKLDNEPKEEQTNIEHAFNRLMNVSLKLQQAIDILAVAIQEGDNNDGY